MKIIIINKSKKEKRYRYDDSIHNNNNCKSMEIQINQRIKKIK